MMKRVLAILLCLALSLGMLLACGNVEDIPTGDSTQDSTLDSDNGSGNGNGNDNTGAEGHTHTFKTDEEWTMDDRGHWYAQTCDCDDVEVRILNHTDTNNDMLCDVCKYVIDGHEHTYSEEWTADCTNHWHAADCGCIIAGEDVAEHVDETGDGECDECGYVIEDLHNHYFATEWSYADGYHWHAALCEHGVEVADKAPCTVNDAGYCTVCDSKVNEIDKSDILAVLKAAIANNYKVTSGNVYYINEIPDLDRETIEEIYYVLGNESAYVKRYAPAYSLLTQSWYQLLDDGTVFGVFTQDGGLNLESISADADSLKGYNYTPSTILGSYSTTATLADTFYALYDISLKDNVTDKLVHYDAETGTYVIAYRYLEINEIVGSASMEDAGNDDSTAESKVDIVTHLYDVLITFTVDDNFVIDNAVFSVGAYNQDIDGDYTYDHKKGTLEMSASALADTYTYVVAQTSGERTYYTAYPKASLVPSSFDLAYGNGEIVENEIKTAVGTYVQFYLTNMVPFSAMSKFIDPEDFTIVTVDSETGEVASFEPFYSSFSGAVCFNPNKVGSYKMTIKYGEFEKTYTLTITPAAPQSINLYPFTWVAGYGENVYTVDENNYVTKIELEVGEAIDFMVRVNPAKADQLYEITIDNDGVISEVTLTNVIAFYDILSECQAYQFKSDVAGKYVITLTSKVDSKITSTIEVYVGDVEQDVKTSQTYEISTPGNVKPSSIYEFEVGVAGKYVITAENLDSTTWLQLHREDPNTGNEWTKIQGLLPYEIELAAGEKLEFRLYGWSDAVTGQNVTVKIEKEATPNSEKYEIETPANLEPSTEYKFVAEAAGTYVFTAENLDSTTWLQLHKEDPDTGNEWTKIQGLLPYEIELAAGEEIDFRLYGWSDAVTGQKVTISIDPKAQGDEGGSDDPVVPSQGTGKATDPFVLTMGENSLVYTGYNYAWAYYIYTAAEDGTLTITMTSDNFDLGYGSKANAIMGSQKSPLALTLEAGEVIYIGLSTSSGSNSSTPITFTASFEANGGGSTDPVDPVENGKDVPFTLAMGENELLYKGYAYAYAFYVYTATESGTLTITAITSDYDLAYGPSPMLMTGFQTSPMVRPVSAGETIYIGVSTETGAASEEPIKFTASFEAKAASSTEDELKDSLNYKMFEFSEDMGLFFFYSEDEGVYFMNASAPDWSWDIYFTYTLTNNGDGTFTITPTYYQRADYETEATQENIDKVLNTQFVINYDGEIWYFGEKPEIPVENTPLELGNTQIEQADATYEYVAESSGKLTLTAGAAAMGMVEISYTVNGGDVEVLELSTSVTLDLYTGDVVVITVVAEGYSSLTAAWEAAAGATLPLELGDTQIEQADATYAYVAEASGKLTLTAGAAIMGMVEISYTVNGGESQIIELSTSVDIDLNAGDVVVVTIKAEGYSSLTAAWAE